MNYLAHMYLSGDDQEVMVGNFIGDGVKGRHFDHFPLGIQHGIKLHRFIDDYTDKHTIVKESKARLRSQYRKYAGVVVDVFYDHFLAVQWHLHHEVELASFIEQSYTTIQSYQALLPEKIQHLLPYMIRQNWLLNYRETVGIGKALSGLSRRTSFVSNMEFAVKNLESDYELFEKEFSAFFPDLVNASTQEIMNIKDNSH